MKPEQPRASILFVDDEPAVLEGLRVVLRSERSRWRCRFAEGGPQAVALLEAEPADVVVSDVRMPMMDGLELLETVRARWPDAVRVVLSGYAELAAVSRASASAHRYLLKPCDSDTLRATLEDALALRALLAAPELRRVVGRLGSLPAVPAVYQALTAALADPDVTMKRVAKIVEQDPGTACRVLQFVNSPYYGLAHEVTGIEAAVVYLGLETLRNLTLTLEVSRAFPAGDEVGAYQRHAVTVARIARRLAGGAGAGERAFSAGLLHDCGKLVLASRLAEPYAAALALARRTGAAPADAEREVIGADHASLGAYLLGMWGLPRGIVESVAGHHALPGEGALEGARAVAVADALAHELADGAPPEVLDALAGDSAELGRAQARAEFQGASPGEAP